MYYSLNIIVTVDCDLPADKVQPAMESPAVAEEIASRVREGKQEGMILIGVEGTHYPGYWHTSFAKV